MQVYTATPMIGQWVPQTSESYDVAQSMTQPFPGIIILFRYVRQEMPLFVVASESKVVDEKSLTQLYAEFAEEDRALANAGMADYARLLAAEDNAE
jgi:hypothetical protein